MQIKRIMVQTSFNPSDNSMLTEYPILTDKALEDKLAKSINAFQNWRDTSTAQRGEFLLKAANLLQQKRSELATLMALEMGKPIKQGISEVDKAANGCRFFAENTERLLAEEAVDLGAIRGNVRFEPLGPLLGIMPWNFPIWQVVRFVAPALMAGNTILLKHAPNVPQCALALENILKEAGLPEGVYQNIFVDNEQIEKIIADPRIRAISFTGSVQTGRHVAALAGKHIKKCVLELGGSDAFVVLRDADLAAAAKTAAFSRLNNAGQACISAKRIIVEAPVYEAFLELLLGEMRKFTLGNPLDETTVLGPMARVDLAEKLQAQHQKAISQGAITLLEGGRTESPGCWYRPALLTNIQPDNLAYHEELFGPVGTIYNVPDFAAAARLANDTPYGLGASVWTQDPQLADRMVPLLEAGTVAINGLVQSDPRMPFGGVKNSGFGRELSGYGVKEFVNVKGVLRYS